MFSILRDWCIMFTDVSSLFSSSSRSSRNLRAVLANREPKGCLELKPSSDGEKHEIKVKITFYTISTF